MRREGWIWTFVAATIVGLLLRQPSLIVMAILLSAAGGVAVYWGKYSLARVTYQRRLSAHKAFQGDVISLDITLTNRKFLPLPYLQIDDLFPDFFESATLKLAPAGVERMKKLKLKTSLGWYEKIEWSFPIDCTRRGSYRLGGHTLRSADMFGFFPSQLSMPADTRLLVYPELRTLADLGLEETMPFGGDSGGDPLFTDPLRIKGTRDYAPAIPIIWSTGRPPPGRSVYRPVWSSRSPCPKSWFSWMSTHSSCRGKEPIRRPWRTRCRWRPRLPM